jgi:hypothetical protein
MCGKTRRSFKIFRIRDRVRIPNKPEKLYVWSKIESIFNVTPIIVNCQATKMPKCGSGSRRPDPE